MAQQTTNPFSPPIAQDAVIVDQANTFTFAWYQWFTLKVARALFAPVSNAVPASSIAAGTPGQISYDQNFLYVCIQANLWKRIPLTAF